jgi:hypothetical protein
MNKLPPKGILPEDVYLQRLDAIIQRDFFPSLSVNNATPTQFHASTAVQGLSLEDFFDLYTSDDNASFNRLHQQDARQEQQRHQLTDALAGGTGEKLAALRLALQNGKDGATPLHRLLLDQRKKEELYGALVQHQSGVVVVRSIKDLPKKQRKIINHNNTSFYTDIGGGGGGGLGGGGGGNGNGNSTHNVLLSAYRSSDVMRVGGYSYVLTPTPSATPNVGGVTPGSTPLPVGSTAGKRRERSSSTSSSSSSSSSSASASGLRSSKRSRTSYLALTPAAKALAARMGGGRGVMASSIRRHQRHRMKNNGGGGSSSSSRRGLKSRTPVGSGGGGRAGGNVVKKGEVPSWPTAKDSGVSSGGVQLPKEVGLTDGLLMMLP